MTEKSLLQKQASSAGNKQTVKKYFINLAVVGDKHDA
jgi:hypothetical protein